MALTLSNSNYNGEVLEKLYTVTGVGNEVVQKGIATLLTGIAERQALPKLSQTDLPIGVYVPGAPTSDTATTTYSERELVMNKMTVYEEFIPSTFHDLWPKWQSVGDFTNIQLNSELLNGVLELYANGIGRQMSKLFWQGNIIGATGDANKLFNGIITRANLDGSVIKPTTQGVITDTNFMDILAAVWGAIPDKYFDDPDYTICVNTTNWKTMLAGNAKLREQFTGVFGQSLETMYQTKKIQHFAGIPSDYIVAGKSDNLFLGTWVAPDAESVVIDKVSPSSHTWFLRLDFKADANYSNASDLVLYEPA